MDFSATFLMQLALNGGLASLLILAIALVPIQNLWNGSVKAQIALGLAFGLAAVLAMNATLVPVPGISIDMRTVICAVSAFAIGPVSGIVTVVITGLYRVSLGGAGLVPGLGAIISVALVGLAWRQARTSGKITHRQALLGLALSTPAVALAWTQALPQPLASELLTRLLVPVSIAFVVGVLLLGSLIELLRSRAHTQMVLAQAVDDLRISRDELSLAVDAAGDGRWSWESNTRYLRVLGPLYEDFDLGDLNSSIELKRWQALIHPDDRPRTKNVLAAYMRRPVGTFVSRFRVKDRNGHWRYVVSRGGAVKVNANGEALRMVGVHIDETALREAEQAVTDERTKLASIFHTLPDAAGSSRISDGRYIEINPAFERLTGYSRGEVIGRTSVELGIWADPTMRERLLEEYQARGRVDRLELSIRSRDGREIPGQMSASQSVMGGEDCFVFVFHDLTQERQVLQELNFSKTALNDAGRLGRLGAWVIYFDGTSDDYWSPVCRDIVGITPDEPVPQNFTERFVLPEHQQLVRELERRARGQLLSWDIEVEIQRVNGQRLWLRIVGEPVVEHGQLQHIRGLMQDVDASHRAIDQLRQSEERFSGIFKFLPEALAIVDQGDGHYIDVNPAWEKLTGYPRDQVVGKNAVEIGMLPRAKGSEMLQSWGRRTPSRDNETEITTRDGEKRTTLLSSRPMTLDGVDCWLSMHRDITERRQVQAKIQEREEQLSLSVAAANLGTWDLLVETGIVSGNARWYQMRGLPANSGGLSLAQVRDTAHPDDLPLLLDGMRAQYRNSEHAFDVVSRTVWPDKSVHWIRDLGKVVTRDAKGRALRMLGLTMDVTHQHEQDERLQHMAHFDPLTGLPNRLLLGDRMKQAMAHAERTGELLGVVYLDLDGFKPVNDRLGHSAGDELLKMIALRLPGAIRAGDSVARLGGDEFVLLLASLADSQDCVLAMQRAMTAIGQPFEVSGESISVTASMGATLYPQDRSDADTLLRHADQAMYVAKQAGRNRFHFFDSEQEEAERTRNDRLAELRDALRGGQFTLHLQPRVNMRTGAVGGAEALARWLHPTLGLLSPAAFLPDIESSELNTEFGEWVIASALDLLGGWATKGHELGLSINITARHLQSPDFSARLQVQLQKHPNVKAKRLEIEVTESGSLSDLGTAVNVIENLHKSGVKVSLDDFGTGYSSLTYLRRLPVDTLKIDQSFVRDMLHDLDDRAIVKAVISLAHSFGREVVAEGVETAAQGTLLLEMGCEMAQGYGIARPMPESELSAWIARWQSGSLWHLANQE